MDFAGKLCRFIVPRLHNIVLTFVSWPLPYRNLTYLHTTN